MGEDVNMETIPGSRASHSGDIAGNSDNSFATMPGARSRPREKRFEIGDTILNRYTVVAELGQGGMGVVYKCLDTVGRIHVALKALPPELSHNSLEMEDIRDNFTLVSKLVHQHIAVTKNLEKDETTGDYYLIMECVEGISLKRWIKERRQTGNLTVEMILPVIRQVAEALDYAHAQKIIHRDIKPGNIMIAPDGTVKVLDFGLAAEIHTSLTRVSMAYHGTSGTGPYMAPEQWRGRTQGAAADQYALAVMTYEMLAGHLPFESTDMAVLKQVVLDETPDPVAGVKPCVQAALRTAMAKEPGNRFASCSDFVQALGGERIAGKEQPGNRKPWGIAAAVLLSAAVIGVIYFSRTNEKAKPASVSTPSNETPFPVSQIVPAPGVSHAGDGGLEQTIYRLQIRAETKYQEIAGHNYDRGQTFGQYLDEIRAGCLAGKNAQADGKLKVAQSNYLSAINAAEWIEKNAPLREGAKRQLAVAEEVRRQADAFEASKTAAEKYAASAEALKTADAALEAGKFPEAIASIQQADAGFKSALIEARRYAVNLKLEAAREARSRSDWQKVKELAEQALTLDGGNQTARELKDEAEKNLFPKLRIVATVDGREVPATIQCGNEQYTAPGSLTLRKNDKCNVKLSYRIGNDDYERSIPVIAAWSGEKTISVALWNYGTVILPRNVKLELVKIKAGSFLMGSPESEQERDNEEKQHRVTLTKDFWIGKYEVTQAQYEAVMGSNPSNFKGENHPVGQVSWKDAMAFCRKLNQLCRNRLPSGYEFTLPTEAQWEYACRAGTTTVFHYGNDLDSSMANCNGNAPYGNGREGVYRLEIVSVGSFKPNALGLYDMHGNVSELCRDWYGDYDRIVTDPVGPVNGSLRVIRGGSFVDFAADCRSANRSDVSPGGCYDNVGFRVALASVQ